MPSYPKIIPSFPNQTLLDQKVRLLPKTEMNAFRKCGLLSETRKSGSENQGNFQFSLSVLKRCTANSSCLILSHMIQESNSTNFQTNFQHAYAALNTLKILLMIWTCPEQHPLLLQDARISVSENRALLALM